MGENFKLGATYGKQSVPVFKIRREGANHSIIDLIVKVMLEGDIDKSWLTGDNSQIVPTETQKNTCYALALKTDFLSIEDYGLALGRDFLARHKHIDTVRLELSERVWERHTINGTPHSHVFLTSARPILRIAGIVVKRNGKTRVTSGVADIKVMKTMNSGFAGYIEDEYTDLKPVAEGSETASRIMCTDMIARWSYKDNQAPEGNFHTINPKILSTLLDTFSGPAKEGVYSLSLQQTAYNMCLKVMKDFSLIDKVVLETPNVHFYAYPLAKFGLNNPNIVFQSTESSTTASGRIVTDVSRAKQAKL